MNLKCFSCKCQSITGDRLTDERIQGAQKAMSNAGTGKQRLQGFISKIEDWHHMMNLLEVSKTKQYHFFVIIKTKKKLNDNQQENYVK